jgi:hypothetical protein
MEELADLFDELMRLESESQRHAFLLRLAESRPELAQSLRRLAGHASISEQLPEILRSSFEQVADQEGATESAPWDAELQLMELLSHCQPTTDPEPAIADLRGYDLHALVSVSSNSFVFRARDRRLDRQVAIKFLSPHLAKDATGAQAFINEAKLASQVTHPGVVKIFHISSPEEMPLVFFVMEWIEGPSLQQCLEERSPTILEQPERRLDQLI